MKISKFNIAMDIILLILDLTLIVLSIIKLRREDAEENET